MTIPRMIDVQHLNDRLGHLEACVDKAPMGTFIQARQARAIIGDACDDLIKALRALGLQPCNGDGIRAVEAVIYGWARANHPDTFETAEGFGIAVGTEAGPRVIAQMARDRDSLQAMGSDVWIDPAAFNAR